MCHYDVVNTSKAVPLLPGHNIQSPQPDLNIVSPEFGHVICRLAS
jgi:hypothetical protein